MIHRKNLVLLLFACVLVAINILTLFGQEAELTSDSATIRGQVIEATEQKPIEGVSVKIVDAASGESYTILTDKNGEYEKTGLPAGRYTVAVSKNGYGDRIGRSKIVVAGGEIFDTIKMRKKENIITFLQKHFFTWQSLVGLAIIILLLMVLFSLRSRV